ncbi:6-phosphofructo-2-kinase/fructose-2,6-bisphosphatase isoform X1 [Spodoptera frugiperda]|uniref:6-phosphofructo-2-kinase/fructose-2, 6-bisphosphatase isoform X1 n=1 Tax=Spodoptera frugiperda TaxID=7108 RepID=A0A9R0DM81_SPOFR|nr:6-phosphofructo-2-kinase/fructose-2,6-bisphosphatase isoform X1 [Spodoptera frugiperda]
MDLTMIIAVSLLMALLSIQGDWYLYIWLIYCKIYSAIIWLFSNHCRGADKVRSVITSGVSGQSPGGLHRVRTRRRRAPQQHRVKHIVALARRPSLRRIVMAPGASTAHTMMEDKEKILNGALATASMRSRRISQFAPLLIALVGLPARGKSQLAHRLARHLNWNGESTKVFDCSEYRRRHMALYGSHDIFRADNAQGSAIRRQSAREAVQDAVLWLKDGNSVAIFDGTNITREQRRELSEYCLSDMGFRILFIECVCEDQELLERNIIEILHYSADYKSMSEEEAVDDLRKKLEHYMRQYEPIDAELETISFVRVENVGETVTAHRVAGQKESGILGYLSGMRGLPQTLYFTRHGESEYNVLGRIGGDASLSPRGLLYAQALADHMNALPCRDHMTVWTSERWRTKQTAAHIRAPKRVVRALNELDAGICEGLTYEEMQERFPQEFAWRDQDKLRYRYPWGESYIDIMTRLRPALSALEDEHNVVVVGHQAVLRCMLGYFLDAKLDELPYMNVPLHTIVKLTSYGYKYKVEMIKLPVDCVDTHRQQPKNCSINRTSADALVTVPSHYDTLPSNLWQNPTEAQL